VRTGYADADEFASTRIRSILRPKDHEPIPDWAARQIKLDATSPIQGSYDITNSPQFKEQFEAFQSDDVRMLTSLGPNQGGRTKNMEIASLWCVKNRPGPMQWNTDTNDKAKDFAEERWWPMAHSCADVLDKLPAHGTGLGAERHRERIRKVIFSDGMPFSIQGCSESNLEQKSIMTQFNDECWQWPVGRLEVAHIRCNVAYAWNYKVWNGSVAGVDGDDMDLLFKSGSQKEWHWHCLKCGKRQIPKWGKHRVKGGIHWDRNEKTKPKDREWDLDEVVKTVFYECEHCGEIFTDSARSRRLLNEGAKYYALNKSAPAWHESFRFNILSVNWPGVLWAQWVCEFLKACEQMNRLRNLQPLRKFWTRRMSEPWDESRHANVMRKVVLSDYKLDTPNQWRTKQWERERMRFMAVDKQESNYWFVIRAVAENGDSRLIDFGSLDSYSEIDEKAKSFGVQSKCVLIDCGFETREVYAMAVKHGWTCMMGVDRASFKHPKEITDNGMVRRIYIELPYSEEKWADPFAGTLQQTINSRFQRAPVRRLARRFDWINLHIKNLLYAFKQGQALSWGVPSDASPEYIRQINSEVRHRIVDAKGRITEWWSNSNVKGSGTRRANHAWDCEAMIVVAMALQGLINLSEWTPEIQGAESQ
jgi:hypothetical protein